MDNKILSLMILILVVSLIGITHSSDYRTPCVNISAIKNADGYVKINQSLWQPGMLDPEGNPAIVICGEYYFDISRIEIVSSNISIYCESGNLLQGRGDNYGFRGNYTRGNITIRNCNLRNFYTGINLIGCNCQLTQNTLENMDTGIQGCRCNISITNNTVRNMTGTYGWGIALTGSLSGHEVIQYNLVENSQIGIWGDEADLIANNTVINASEVGIRERFDGSVIDNHIINAPNGTQTGIEVRIDNSWPNTTVRIKENLVENAKTGIYLYYANYLTDEPYNPSISYLIRKNTMRHINSTGIFINGNNYQYNWSSSRIDDNIIYIANVGITVMKRANNIYVRNNDMYFSQIGLNCSYSYNINWSCNDCHGGYASLCFKSQLRARSILRTLQRSAAENTTTV